MSLITNTYYYSYEDLLIDDYSIYSILGYKDETDIPFLDILTDVKNQISAFDDMAGGFEIKNNINLNMEAKTFTIDGVVFNPDKIVFNKLKKSNKFVLLISTAGKSISELSRKYMDQNDLLTGYIYDVYGSVIADKIADIVQNKIEDSVNLEGLNITNRYSPGYCGWNVSEQHKLFSVLSKNLCQVTLTDSAIMKPIKSISAIVGIAKDAKREEYNCSKCYQENCLYKNLTK